MIIRLCTENKNHEQVRALCAKHFEAFTLYYGLGAWKGEYESSLTIDIAQLGEPTSFEQGQFCMNARRLALEIKALNGQEAVLLEYIDSKNELI